MSDGHNFTDREMKCPVCGCDMKEFVIWYRCRNLDCRSISKKYFQPSPPIELLENVNFKLSKELSEKETALDGAKKEPKEEEIREAFEKDMFDHTLSKIMVVDGIYQTKPNVRTDRQVNGMVNEYNHDYIIFKDGYTAQSKKLEEMSIELDSTIDMRDKFGRDIDDLEQQIEKYTISDSDKSLEIEQLKQHILYLSK